MKTYTRPWHWIVPMVLLGWVVAADVSSAQQQDPLVRAINVHGGSAVETIVRIQMRGRSSNGQTVTISAALVGNDANSLRVDYGWPVTKSFVNTPKGAAEVTVGAQKPTAWKPVHVGTFAQLDMLSVLGIQHLTGPQVQRTAEESSVVNGRNAVQVRAVTDRFKTLLRRQVADDVHVKLDEAAGVVVEILRRQFTETNMDLSFWAGFRFSDYRTVQGILLPYRIERVMNGTVRETITLEAIELNPPLTTTFFTVPDNHLASRVVGRRP